MSSYFGDIKEKEHFHSSKNGLKFYEFSKFKILKIQNFFIFFFFLFYQILWNSLNLDS